MVLSDKEYLLRLDLALSELPFEEREDAIQFVKELFAGAIQEGVSVEVIMKRLGSPEDYALSILGTSPEASSFQASLAQPIKSTASFPVKKSSHPFFTLLKGLGIIILALVAIPLLFAGFMVVLSLLFTLIMMILSLAIGFGSCILATILIFFKGIYLLVHDPLGAVYDFGCTLFGIGLAWLLKLALQWIWRKLPMIKEKFQQIWAWSLHSLKTRRIWA